ncbi:MAG: NAD(+) synthase [Bacteroidales bacterium]|nr:NAD(+) synthase [Bacteroidales bacterium]
MNYGFVKIASAVPEIRVADPKYNVSQIESLIIQAEGRGVEIICLPELCLTGYTCADLFSQQLLLDEAEMALIHLMNFSRSLDIISIVGLPVSFRGSLVNCAAVVQKGKLLGLVPKTYLPNYREFQERRWFTSAADLPSDATVLLCGQQVVMSARQLFRTPTCTFGVELCEDLWAPVPPSCDQALQGADIIFNLSADNDVVGKYEYLESLLCQQSSRLISGYVYSAAGFGESTQDLVFSGKALIMECGKIIAEGERHSMKAQLLEGEIDVERIRADRRLNTTFAACAARERTAPYRVVETALITQHEFHLMRSIDPHPFVPTGSHLDERCREIINIQTEGLAKRLHHIGCQTAVIGISGGLDSTLALLVTVETFDRLKLDRHGIVGVTMPGFGTTDRTYNNAVDLMHALGITIEEINIGKSVMQHFEDIGHHPDTHDVTYENSQARERTQILMDLANQLNGLVIGTGDLSELALGWCTYNGDHMSMYGVNAGVPKTLVRHLVTWMAQKDPQSPASRILLDIVDTPISPELLPANTSSDATTLNSTIAQKTEDLVGPYELHDFFLYYALRFGFRPSKIYYLAQQAFGNAYPVNILKQWLRNFYHRFFGHQFKRSCLPDGPKVGSISLSPRGDWRMPSDACREAWLAECDAL